METNNNVENQISETQEILQEEKQEIRQLVPPQEAFDKQREIEKQYLETVKQANQ
jgi:hypothetical protein